MNKSILLALASAAALVLPAVVMAQDTKPPEVNISGVPLNLDAGQHVVHMSDSEFAKYKRTYELSNGNTLSLFSRADLKFAKLGDGAWHAIVATGTDSFASEDKQLKMEIHLQDDDVVSGYVLMRAETPSLAADGSLTYRSVSVAFR